jgi:DNA primase
LTTDRAKLVKDALDIVEVVSGYISLRPAGKTYKGLCPFHDDHRPSFDVDPTFQRYRCWSCGKSGDVISFVMEHEHVNFIEALELLARRAGIQLDAGHPRQAARKEAKSRLLEVLRWAADVYQECLLESDLGDAARRYLGERRLLGPTIRKFGVGFAPLAGDWFVRKAVAADIDFDLLQQAGLIAPRTRGPGYYDRFRDRVLFPIRDPLGRTIGFGGRIMPGSPLDRAPKYYNSPESPVFSKSEQVYGLDLARGPAAKAGYVAVVEGYTDVLMAHQCGVGQVVATMGTALTARHVHHLRRFVPRVVLLFDADAGGNTGVDRALEIFASKEVDLAVATLPAGLDPFDLLTRDEGPDHFRAILDEATDALDFKLSRILGDESGHYAGVEGRRRAVDAVLRVIAQAPEQAGHADAVKRELMVGRIARRLALKEETVWARLEELRREVRDREPRPAREESGRAARPAPEERQLLEVLLAEPGLITLARKEVRPEEMAHLGLRKMLQALYDLQGQVEGPVLDQARERLDSSGLGEWVLRLHDVGRLNQNRAAWLTQVLHAFRQRRQQAEQNELNNQLHAVQDHGTALELLRQLQNPGGL